MSQTTRPPVQSVRLPANPFTVSRWIPFKIAGLYLLFSLLWINLSGLLFRAMVSDRDQLARLEVYKDWAFCFLSAGLLILLVRRDWWQIRAAHAAVSASEGRYRLLIETAPEAIVVYDLDRACFVEYNAQAERFFEARSGELGRYGPVDLSPEFQPDGVRSKEKARVFFEAAMAGGMPVFEWRHRSLGGREIPCEVRLLALPSPAGVRQVRGTITDITARQRAADLLARSEESYRILFEHATDAIFLCAADGRLLDANNHAQDLLGQSRAELTQKNMVDLVAPEDHPLVRACLQEFQRENTRQTVCRFLGKGGRIFPGEASTKRLPDGRLLAIMRDITDRQLAEQQQQRLERELRQAQKLQAMGTLAGGIAHDFNNILAAILGNAQLLQMMLPPADQGQGTVSQILVASHRAKDLVQQILMFSRQREQSRQSLQLGPLVREATKLIGVSLPPSVQLQMTVPADLPPVLADATQVHQVIVNLCTNAVHAMRQDGGTLQLILAETALPENSSYSKPNLPAGRYVCLTVADSGHGMDAATLERIYEPFFTTKPVGEGTGLGLAVVHGIMQSSEGGISVTSQPGQGTTFRLYFPAQATAETAEPVPAAGLKSGKGQRILFVDDEVPITIVAEAMLEKLGYQVEVCTDPREALRRLHENGANLSLLMTDLSMPGLSGVDLIREAMRLHPQLPAILLTGYGKAFDSRAAVGLNISEVVHKPFTLEYLSNAIESALRRAP